MHASPLHYFPVTGPFLAALVLLVVIVIALIELRVLVYAYETIGVSRRYVFGLLLLSLIGSYINIPFAELPEERMVRDHVVNFFGVQYVIPEVKEWPRTILAVNLGGAVIPTILSLYLLVKNRLYIAGLVGVAIVATVVHWLAYPVRGLGIATPTFAPPITAAVVALVLSRRAAPALAYISGSLGTMIGADLLNLGRIQGLGAPVASIGGAGTFDAIFLTGILAVLLAGIGWRPQPPQPPDEDVPQPSDTA
jgi:uncharacterized membrane protein